MKVATFASEFARLHGGDTTGLPGPFDKVWRKTVDAQPPETFVSPPPFLGDAEGASWVLSQPVELMPGITARAFVVFQPDGQPQ